MHRLKRPFRDGTTEFLFEPLDFLARLAALVPRPRSHLLRYHGVLAPNARHRRPVSRHPHLVSATDDTARTADHHPSLTTRIPTFEILRSAGDMGLWSSYPPMLKAGREFVGHGYVQRSLNAEENEEEVIERSLARLERLTGKKTRGWLGPGFGETFDTPDILKKYSIEWLSDWFIEADGTGGADVA